ncbi:hypothetical protein [Thermocatellispora tengchongensis]|uniref:hypothetical protein n=1 Tax=Thermocatellispora tengchongensis TaxID=1073253 RepID=UPI003625193C
MVGRAGTWGEATGRELIAALAVAQAARARPVVAELRRRDAAGLLPAEQFAAALRALAARGDRAPAAAALAWIAESAPARADASLPALALLVRHPVPAIRDRAVRLALRLAPHAGAEAGKAIREAAAQLPPEHRHPLTRAYGAQTLVPAPPVPAPRGPAEPPAPIGSPAGLARALRALRWPAEPAQVEPVLAALVELAARDRSSSPRPWPSGAGPSGASGSTPAGTPSPRRRTTVTSWPWCGAASWRRCPRTRAAS